MKRSLTWLWVSLGLVVALGCCWLGLTGLGALKAEPAPDPLSILQASTTTVVTPSALGERDKIENAQVDAIVSELVATLRTMAPDAKGTAAAFYGRDISTDRVMIAAIAGQVTDSGALLDETVREFSAETTLVDVKFVSGGSLGGDAKCAREDASDPMIMCAWAVHGSFGIVLWFDASLDEAVAEFIAIREQIEHRSLS